MYYNYSITIPLTTKNISFQSLYLIESKPYFLVEVSRMTFVEDSNRWPNFRYLTSPLAFGVYIWQLNYVEMIGAFEIMPASQIFLDLLNFFVPV